jgi:hypothetical protein
MFSFAEPIPGGALDIINKRIREDAAPQTGTAAGIPRIPAAGTAREINARGVIR